MVVFIYIHILIVRYVVFLGYTHVQIANRIHFYLAAKQIGNVKYIRLHYSESTMVAH